MVLKYVISPPKTGQVVDRVCISLQDLYPTYLQISKGFSAHDSTVAAIIGNCVGCIMSHRRNVFISGVLRAKLRMSK